MTSPSRPGFSLPASPRLAGLALAALAASLALFAHSAEAGQRLSWCGGRNQQACKLWEAIPSCDPFLFENVESCGFLCFVGMCRDLPCGGAGQRACIAFVEHPWPDLCKRGTGFVYGFCTAVDANGFPGYCGHDGQSACTLDLQIQLGIASCAPHHFEEGFPSGTCRALDAAGFPQGCGDHGEPACTVDLQLQIGIGACKPGLEEAGYPAGSCRRPLDMARPARTTWDPEEAPAGPRTVFLVHGAGSSNQAWDGGLVEVLEERTVGVDVYVVDYNTTGDGAPAGEPFTVYRRRDGTFTQVTDTSGAPLEFGTQDFNGENFDLPTLADALAEAIETLPTQSEIVVIGHSMGGLVVRQLVYEHYDSLRLAGKRISEVVTLASPHQGGGLDPLELAAVVTGIGMCSRYAVTQATPEDRQFFWQNCEAYRWRDAVEARGVSIDDRDYPEIRWAVVAGTSQMIEIPGVEIQVGYDSDGIVPVASAFGIEADDCFPHDHLPGPNGETDEIRVETADVLIDSAVGPVTVESALCHDPRHDPAEQPAYLHDDRLNNTRADGESFGHALQSDPAVHAFVRSLFLDPAIECSDGLDNDGDGLSDFDDPRCSQASPESEREACGLGFELALVLPALAAWRRRRRRAA